MDIITGLINSSAQSALQSDTSVVNSKDRTNSENTSSSGSRVSNTTNSALQISARGHSISLLMQGANEFLRQELGPSYLPLARGQALLDQAVSMVTANTEIDIDGQALRNTLQQEHNIRETIPRPNPSSDSGNVFDFLSGSDREALEAAYDYAVENNLDADDVELAAGLLASDRRRPAAIASGTIYLVHEPSENAGKFIPQSSANLPNTDISNPRQSLIDRVTSGDLFSKNPFLNQALFIEAAFRTLQLKN